MTRAVYPMEQRESGDFTEWQKLTYAERAERISAGYMKGLSSSQVAETIEGATKGAVLGFCHKVGLRLANAHVFKIDPARADYRYIDTLSLGRTGGTGWRQSGRVRGPNRATDESTYQLIDAIDNSGHRLLDIALVSGLSLNTIQRWRAGKHKASRFNTQVVYSTLTKLDEERDAA